MIDSSGTQPPDRQLTLCIAFTIQEANYHELPGLVDWVESVGARLLHLKHLNVISNRQDLDNSLLKYRLNEPNYEEFRRRPSPLQSVEENICRIREQSARKGIRLLVHSEVPLTDEMRPRHCLAAPLDAVYFSYDGMVSPCCHFGHTVSRFFQGRFEPPKALFLGDIKRQDFLEIWNSSDFVNFRQGFMTENYPHVCRSCYLLYGK
jgi:MoaA/NifB/PqqE/SkfB family radical SAM enzyme